MAGMAVVVLGLSLSAVAAPVHGTVRFPDEVKGAARHPGYWRVENGVLPLGPLTHDIRTEAVVALFPQGTVTGAQVAAAAAQEHAGKTRADIKIIGLRLYPSVVVIPPGGSVVFHNEDQIEHAFAVTCNPAATAPLRQSVLPAAESTLTLDKPGDCMLRSPEYAHLVGTVLVVERGFYGRIDANGDFLFDAPEGHYLARLFFRGAWLASQPIDVVPDGIEISLKIAGPQFRSPPQAPRAKAAVPRP